MYYEIPGNDNYDIDHNGDIRALNGVRDIVSSKGHVTISLYNVVYTLPLKWLINLAKHKLFMPEGYEQHIYKYVFHDYDLKSHKVDMETMPTFKTPVTLIDDSGFRLIPSYPCFAINEGGDVIDLLTHKKHPLRGSGDYPTVCVTHRLHKKPLRQLRHRLVAMAWVENDDYGSKTIVDHLYGDKSACNAKDLEWVSFSTNNRRAATTGLKTDSIDIKVMDFKSGNVTIFGSMTEACEFMGRSRINRVEEFCDTDMLISGQYQIKLLLDSSDWLDYESQSKPYRFTVDDNIYAYMTLSELKCEHFPNIGRKGQDTVIKHILIRWPEAKIDFPLPAIQGKVIYQAKNLLTGEVFETDVRAMLSDWTGLSKSGVAKAIVLGDGNAVGDFTIRPKSDEPWIQFEDTHLSHPKSIKAIEVSTGKELTFPSYRKLASYLNVDKKLISNAMSYKNGHIRGYHLYFI